MKRHSAVFSVTTKEIGQNKNTRSNISITIIFSSMNLQGALAKAPLPAYAIAYKPHNKIDPKISVVGNVFDQRKIQGKPPTQHDILFLNNNTTIADHQP